MQHTCVHKMLDACLRGEGGAVHKCGGKAEEDEMPAQSTILLSESLHVSQCRAHNSCRKPILLSKSLHVSLCNELIHN